MAETTTQTAITGTANDAASRTNDQTPDRRDTNCSELCATMLAATMTVKLATSTELKGPIGFSLPQLVKELLAMLEVNSSKRG